MDVIAPLTFFAVTALLLSCLMHPGLAILATIGIAWLINKIL